MQGASEVQISTVLSTTVRASGLHNDRGMRQALRRGLSRDTLRGSVLLGCFEPGRLHLGGLRVPALVPPYTGLVTSLRDESGLAFGVQVFYNAR